MNAIYVRQSIDKHDSISIESQIEACLKEFDGGDYRIYNDKGFSGKNTDRPQFKNMIKDIENGIISSVFVYRIDRISRAIVDFGRIMELFEKKNVDFISHTEKFDTSTPIGKAMLNIIMVFAQLERETIQQRITDNYYSRGEKGLYLGGYAPFGYAKKEIRKDGKRTYCYEVIDNEAVVIREMYEWYASGKSLNSIAKRLNNEDVQTRKKCAWSSNSVSRILHSPVYVCADAYVYRYLKDKGACMNNPVSDYIGMNGCYVYGNVQQRKTSSKFHKYDTDYVTIGNHKGIVPPQLWLCVQNRFDKQKKHSNNGSGETSWLQGLVRCEYCGYSAYVKKYKGGQSYFYCRGKSNGTCRGMKKMIRTEVMEKIAENVILNRISSIKDIKISSDENPEMIKLKIKFVETEEKIKRIVNLMTQANEITMKYINTELERLEREKSDLLNKIDEFEFCLKNDDAVCKIINSWNEYNLNTKKSIACATINHIEVNGTNIRFCI